MWGSLIGLSILGACFPFLVVHKIAVHLIVDGNLESMKCDVYVFSVCFPH